MGKPYIKNCCFFCTEREVNCKGCTIAKEGLLNIKNKCQKHFEADVCIETFGDKVNKNLCFTPDDKDIESLEGKSTTALSVNNKEEEELPDIKVDPTKMDHLEIGADSGISLGQKKKEKSKVSNENQTNKVVEAIKEAAKNGDIDIKVLLEKLGKKE